MIVNPFNSYDSKEEHKEEERSSLMDTRDSTVRAYDYHNLN